MKKDHFCLNKNSTAKNIRHMLKKYSDKPTVKSHTRMLPADLKHKNHEVVSEVKTKYNLYN